MAYADLRDPPAAALACLSQSEIDRARQIKSQHRRKQFVCTRILLRSLLERYTGHPTASHELIANDKGRPVCTDGPAISIAHSGDVVICAATDLGEIGIDIESTGQKRDVKGIANMYFAENEAAWLATQSGDRFYMLWALKEAWLKATGLGLAGGLDNLCCSVTPPDITVHNSPGNLEALSLFAVRDSFMGLATTAAPHRAVEVNYWDPVAGRFAANGSARLIASTA